VQTVPDKPNPFDFSDGGFFSFVMSIGVIVAFFVTVLPSLWVGGALILYWIISISVIVGAYDEHSEHQPDIGIALIVGSICLSFLAGIPVYIFHWVSFELAGWIVTGLFVGGLVFGVFSRLKAFLAFLAVLCTAAMVTSLVLLPVPSASIAEDDTSRSTFVDLLVVDEFDNPRPNARAQCELRMIWNANDAPKVTTSISSGTGVTEDGRASFVFHEDPRMKVAVCSAIARRIENWGEGTTEPGYKLASAASDPLILGLRVDVKVRLVEHDGEY